MSSENEVEEEEERSLHHLLRRRNPNAEDVQSLIDKYPDEVMKKEGRYNSLPLHTALMCRASVEVILLLINEYPQAAKTRAEGLLPLGAVLNNGSSDEVVLAVLEAYPEAAKDTFSTKSDVRILPLHIAHEKTRSEEVKKALLAAYPGAEEEKNPFETTLRLHKLLEDTAPDEDVLELINIYPDAVGKRGRDGRLPLHIALMREAARIPHTGNLPLHDVVENMNASEEIVLSLLNAYPQAATEKMEDGRLPFEICLERKASDDLLREICKVRVDDGLLPLGFVLTKRSSDDVVLAVLKAYPEAAGKRFSTNFDECILPLHIAYEDKHSEPVKDALLRAYPDAEKNNPFETIYLLHKLLENAPLDQDGDDVRNLIKMYPEAVGKEGEMVFCLCILLLIGLLRGKLRGSFLMHTLRLERKR